MELTKEQFNRFKIFYNHRYYTPKVKPSVLQEQIDEEKLIWKNFFVGLLGVSFDWKYFEDIRKKYGPNVLDNNI